MERDGSGLVQSLRRDPRQGRHRPTSSPTDLVGKLFMRHDTSNWTDGILTATAPPPAGCRFAAQSECVPAFDGNAGRNCGASAMSTMSGSYTPNSIALPMSSSPSPVSSAGYWPHPPSATDSTTIP
ncbi:hypothetical protein CSPX01_01719 [Colletotrichum filicis]|nr:hypothetical protein CSPX01_01719 [Colletotrichum filicis]